MNTIAMRKRISLNLCLPFNKIPILKRKRNNDCILTEEEIKSFEKSKKSGYISVEKLLDTIDKRIECL